MYLVEKRNRDSLFSVHKGWNQLTTALAADCFRTELEDTPCLQVLVRNRPTFGNGSLHIATETRK
jgi:hypothetical protein